jgi:hypothetical protein
LAGERLAIDVINRRGDEKLFIHQGNQCCGQRRRWQTRIRFEKAFDVPSSRFVEADVRACLKMWRQPSWLPVKAASCRQFPGQTRGWKPP